jgi:hypothetical protein
MANEKKKQVKAKMLDLLDATTDFLRARIASGEAGAQEVKNIIQLLKDNNIDTDIKEGEPLAELLDKSLPFLDDFLPVGTAKQ